MRPSLRRDKRSAVWARRGLSSAAQRSQMNSSQESVLWLATRDASPLVHGRLHTPRHRRSECRRGWLSRVPRVSTTGVERRRPWSSLLHRSSRRVWPGDSKNGARRVSGGSTPGTADQTGHSGIDRLCKRRVCCRCCRRGLRERDAPTAEMHTQAQGLGSEEQWSDGMGGERVQRRCILGRSAFVHRGSSIVLLRDGMWLTAMHRRQMRPTLRRRCGIGGVKNNGSASQCFLCDILRPLRCRSCGRMSLHALCFARGDADASAAGAKKARLLGL